jgi:hypothetical protein
MQCPGAQRCCRPDEGRRKALNGGKTTRSNISDNEADQEEKESHGEFQDNKKKGKKQYVLLISKEGGATRLCAMKFCYLTSDSGVDVVDVALV